MSASPGRHAADLSLFRSVLDRTIDRILVSWPGDSFVDRETADTELRKIADWLTDPENRGATVADFRDRLLARRLSELLLQGLLEEWRRQESPGHPEDGDAEAYMNALAALHRLPRESLPEHTQAFENRLADPDGFELVVQLGHDLRSPLTSVTFLAETLLGGHSGPVNDLQRTQLGLIYSASVGIGAIVTDVVDLARAGGELYDGEPQPFSIHATLDAVRRLVQPLAEVKGVEFRTRVATHDRVLGHPMSLNRILMNLVINGLKFTESGWVEASVESAGPQQVRFAVRDTGRGIPDGDRERLFQPFRKAAVREGSFFSSSGLGLSIVQRLLLSLDSELEVESAPDWGTEFHFTLHLPPVTSF